MCKTYPVT